MTVPPVRPARRLRATFLLRLVILLACLALIAAVVLFGLATGWLVGAIAVALALWVVGLELGVLLEGLEWLAVRRAARRGIPVHSPWFVDLDAQRERALARFHEETGDNPTIR